MTLTPWRCGNGVITPPSAICVTAFSNACASARGESDVTAGRQACFLSQATSQPFSTFFSQLYGNLK